jgi:REP element-mobilizing transposase RayT
MSSRYNPGIHHRRSIRLKGYDYSRAGYYFITICTASRSHLFGEVENGRMILNDAGEIVKNEWYKSSGIRREIELHEFVVMPNHIHGIVEIVNAGADAGDAADGGDTADGGANVGANGRSPVPGDAGDAPNDIRMRAKSIGSFVSGFKSAFTARINRIDSLPGRKIWHRNYWEHIIRNENEYCRIAKYIIDNPVKWKNDKLNNGIGNKVMETPAEYVIANEDWMV